MQAEQESQNGIQIDLDALINLDVEINLDAQIDLYAQFTEDHKKINVEFFKQCYKLKEEIIEGNYAEAIRWAAEEKLYETYGELL